VGRHGGVLRSLRAVPLLLALVGGLVAFSFALHGWIGAKHADAASARRGGAATSLLRADNLTQALNRVGDRAGNEAVLQGLTIYPGYLAVDAAGRGGGGQGQSLRVQDDGAVQSSPGALVASEGTVALADVDPYAVEDIARRAAARGHTDLDGVRDVTVRADRRHHRPSVRAYLAR
jgi:hypothetical protein